MPMPKFVKLAMSLVIAGSTLAVAAPAVAAFSDSTGSSSATGLLGEGRQSGKLNTGFLGEGGPAGGLPQTGFLGEGRESSPPNTGFLGEGGPTGPPNTGFLGEG